jgi:catechol 2,3-dioxygenase-like lactoylglutathione lyase family enzyme
VSGGIVHVGVTVSDLERSVRFVGSSHICFRVGDVATALRRAEAAGGRRVTDPVDIDSGINGGGAAVYLRDPDGYTIELFQPPT